MNNLQLYIAIALPTIAVLASLVVSLVQISAIRDDMREQRNDFRALRGEFAALRAELTGKLDLLTGKVYELMERH